MTFAKFRCLYIPFLIISLSIWHELLNVKLNTKQHITQSHRFVACEQPKLKKETLGKINLKNNKILDTLQNQLEQGGKKSRQLNIKKHEVTRKIDKSLKQRPIQKQKQIPNIKDNLFHNHKNSKNGKNGEINFTHLRTSKQNTTNNIKNQEENRLQNDGCKENSNDCINNKVAGFVRVMSGVYDNQNKKEVSNKLNKDNVYDDEHHTVIIYDGLDENKDIYKKLKKKTKRSMKTKVIKGTEYLGVGYDIIFGNPIGDPFLKVDPGYRDSIIKLTYPKNDEDYPESYTNVNPNGSYVRDEISCNRSEHDSEITSMKDYSKELSVDASISASYAFAASFSASAGYQDTFNSISKNKTKIFMLKSYCFKYVAFLSQYAQWKLTDQFVRAINLLPSYFNSLEHDGLFCEVDDYKSDPKTSKCGKSVESWMFFFKSFGTHVSTVIHLGGKITQQVKISKSAYKTLSQQSVNVSVGVSGRYGLFSASASVDTSVNTSNTQENSESSVDKETIIIGGVTIYDPNNSKNFEKWAESIKDNPMPIKGQYEPLSRILPVRLIDVYHQAVQFYTSVHTPLQIQFSKDVDVKSIDLKKRIKNANTKYISGPGLNVIECPIKSNFLFGFTLTVPISFKNIDEFHLGECEHGSDRCYSKMSNDSYSYLFGVCDEDTIPYLEQKTISGKGLLTLKCTEKNQIVLFGFGISILNSDDPTSISMYACKYGSRFCTMQGSSANSAVGLWIVCGHQETGNSNIESRVDRVYNMTNNKKNLKFQRYCTGNILFSLLIQFSATPADKSPYGRSLFWAYMCPSYISVNNINEQYIKSMHYYAFTLY
ncbi:perforin-like protein 3, putative [Hepatocystis sp. ex Piliocolobus tephrosceles]|nr:perforin-like protein 3, putative [Hepatocystis sp. ex Piliocolobus tephrosceles]